MKNMNPVKSKKQSYIEFAIYLFLTLVFGIACSQSEKLVQKVSEPSEPVTQEEYIAPPPPPGAENWPSFRGIRASGIAGGQDIPLNWNAEKGINIMWKIKIPGLGHSSPVVWKDRVFITTAVGKDEEPFLKVGRYGESPDNPEKFTHHFNVYCIDKNSGKIVWKKTAYRGIPKVKRHIKSSHANSTIAADGKHVVAFFGSEGVYCYNMEGKLLWKKDLGYLDAGAFDAPGIQWGFGSSPIIYKEKLIVLCDVNNQSFIAAFNVATGKEIWRTLRDEVPTWGTPTVHEAKDRVQVIVNGYKHIGSYDVETGKGLWRLSGGGDVPVPTPVVAHDLVFITNAHGRLNPIYAIKLNAHGDISLAKGEKSNEYVSWYKPRRGVYQSTPIVYGDYLYLVSGSGVLTCYKAKTGEQVYRERITGRRSAYTASPVAADGRLYFSDEYGNIQVIKAGPKYEHLAANKMGESCLASPAISGGMLFIRTNRHLFGIGKGGQIAAAHPRPSKEIEDKKLRSVEGKPGPEKMGETGTKTLKPIGKMTDPLEILKIVDAESKAVNAVKYDVDLKGDGALESQVGTLKATVISDGFMDGFPERLIVNGEVQLPDSDKVQKFTGGSDGNEYFIIDHNNRSAKVDLEVRGISGPLARYVLGGVIREYHHDEPFKEEIECEKKTLKGIKKINGEDCYEVHLTFPSERSYEVTWFFSVKDFLPRGRFDYYVLQNGKKGGVIKLVSNLVVEPKLAPDTFKFKLPKGYTKKDDSTP